MVLAVPDLPLPVVGLLLEVQHDLFDLGGELSIPGHTILGPNHIIRLEQALDGFNDELPPLREFILPAGSRNRRLVIWRAPLPGAPNDGMDAEGDGDGGRGTAPISEPAADLLFVLARVLVRHERGSEVLWRTIGAVADCATSPLRYGQSNFAPGSSLRPAAMSLCRHARRIKSIAGQERRDHRTERTVLGILVACGPCPSSSMPIE